MASNSHEIERILGLYSGPEEERVRAAVLKLAGGDIQFISYYISVAMVSYQSVLDRADGNVSPPPAESQGDGTPVFP